MKKVTIEDIEPLAPPDENIPEGAMADSIGGARQLSEPLGTSGMAINYYELEPGESFAHSSHRHNNQEEVLHIQSGTATFETETKDITVNAGEMLGFRRVRSNSEPTVETNWLQHSLSVLPENMRRTVSTS